jgi:hypothetical protein
MSRGRSAGDGAVEVLEEAAVTGAVSWTGVSFWDVGIGSSETSSTNGLVALNFPSFNLLRAADLALNLSPALLCVSVSGVHHA